jgi:hypothetical protein
VQGGGGVCLSVCLCLSLSVSLSMLMHTVASAPIIAGVGELCTAKETKDIQTI